MRYAALVCLLLACGQKTKEQPAASPAASGSAAADSPATPAPVAATPPGGTCNDDEIKQRIESSLGGSTLYMNAVLKKSQRWGKDCESIKLDLLALEPDAAAFIKVVNGFVDWARTLAPECRPRIEAIGKAVTNADELDKTVNTLKAKIDPILERCKEHPGFQEAVTKGLQVMRKKKPAASGSAAP
jgi:hypothetical protein